MRLVSSAGNAMTTSVLEGALFSLMVWALPTGRAHAPLMKAPEPRELMEMSEASSDSTSSSSDLGDRRCSVCSESHLGNSDNSDDDAGPSRARMVCAGNNGSMVAGCARSVSRSRSRGSRGGSTGT